MVGTWNSTWPIGTNSVRANRIPGQNNTTYTEANMKLDHFWNEDVNKDGHHKKIEMPKRATDVTLSTGMDGAMYFKEVSPTNLRIEGFYRSANGIYQFIPSFKSGTVVINSQTTFTTITNVSANSYGEIFMWQQGTRDIQKGIFVSDATIVETYSLTEIESKNSLGVPADESVRFITFANTVTFATDLNIKARRLTGAAGTYEYRIIYRGV